MPKGQGKHWSAEELNRLRELYPKHGYREVAEILGRTETSVKSKGKVLGLGDRSFWSAEEIKRLGDLYPNTANEEIGRILGRSRSAIDGAGRKFGLSKTAEYLTAHARLQKGSDIGTAFRFHKGQTPANKGVRRPGWHAGRMQETQFKKGGRPQTWKPIGTVLPEHEGYLRVKVKERAPGENGWHAAVWPLVHHRTWIEHNGPIPEGYAVVFKDGDRKNCAIENLERVSRGELAKRNAMWGRYPEELTAAIMANAALKRKLRRASGQE